MLDFRVQELLEVGESLARQAIVGNKGVDNGLKPRVRCSI